MNKDELERTGVFHSISKLEEEDSDILEIIEEYEDRVDYLDISDDEKKEIMDIVSKIKK